MSFPVCACVFSKQGRNGFPMLFVNWNVPGVTGDYPARKNPREYLKAGNIFISIEADEDVGYLLNIIGEDQLIIASDYPHEDPSRAENMLGELHSRTDLDPKLRQKILSYNAARLYGL